MIRVTHLITGLSTGGAEMMLAKLLSRIDRSRFDCDVISLTDVGTVGERIREMGVPVSALAMRRGVPSPAGVLRLVRRLRQRRPQILQTWLYHADLSGALAGKLSRVPVIVWNVRTAGLDRTDHPRSLFWVLAVLARFSRLPKAVIVNSSAGRTAHERLGYRPRRWELIPNGFDTEAYRPSEQARRALHRSLALPDAVPLVGLVARFHPMKDHANFLEAARRLCERRPEVRIVMAGQGIDASNACLRRTIADLNLDGCVHLLGARSDAPELLAGLDVAVSSSYGEGSPNVIGEAMACGVPCVVTDAGDSRALVGEAGLVVRVRDPEGLAGAIDQVLSMSEDGRRAVGLAGRERIRSLFSIERIAKRYEDLYTELAAGE